MRFLLVLLAVAPWTVLAATPTLMTDEVRGLLTVGSEAIASYLRQTPIDLPQDSSVGPKNVLLELVTEVVEALIPSLANLTIPQIGNETSGLFLENTVYTGLEDLDFTLFSPGVSYNIDNLTLYFPTVEINADHYTINDHLWGLSLNGDGTLNTILEGFKLYAKIDMTYRSNLLYPLGVPEFSLELAGSSFDLTNLGPNACEGTSDLLNNIAGSTIPRLVSALNNDIQTQMASGDWANITEPVVCGVVGMILNGAWCSIHPSNGCDTITFEEMMCNN